MRIVTRSDVEAVLDLREVIEAVEHAHRQLVLGGATQPGRACAPIPGNDGLLVPMTATVDGAGGVKLLADLPGNPESGRPRQQSSIILVDTATGRPEALLDGAVLTRFRTAAASAVATRALSNPDSSVLGLIGAGALARAHLEAIAVVRPIRTVVVWSRDPATAQAFRDEMAGSGREICVAETPVEAVQAADVVCTLTPAVDPIVRGAWLRPGQHLNVVGAPPRPHHREIDAECLRRARVVVDSRHTALTESGAAITALREGAISEQQLETELGEVLAGVCPGRTGRTEITLFNSVGVAVQDIATAALVLRHVAAKGLGVEIALDR
ncbi:alanine dehydrogenase [Streptomyces sp. AA4]|nr:alanine dehydrogenase [Streptomyces sp. AA4]